MCLAFKSDEKKEMMSLVLMVFVSVLVIALSWKLFKLAIVLVLQAIKFCVKLMFAPIGWMLSGFHR